MVKFGHSMDKNFIKNLFFIFPFLFIVATIYPSLDLPLNDDTHEHLSIIHGNDFFGRDLNFSFPQPIFYLKHYGIQFATLTLVYKLFDFDSKSYFMLSLFF